MQSGCLKCDPCSNYSLPLVSSLAAPKNTCRGRGGGGIRSWTKTISAVICFECCCVLLLVVVVVVVVGCVCVWWGGGGGGGNVMGARPVFCSLT